MKIEYVLKHIKLMLWGVAVVFMAQILFTAQTHADNHTAEESRTQVNDEREARLAEVSATLIQVGATIAASTEITNEERITLFTQLIELSRAIVALQRSMALEAATAREREEVPEGTDIVTLEETNLHKVAVQLDMDTFEAEITEYYLDEDDDLEKDPFGVEYDRVERTMTLTQPENDDLSFADKVLFAKNQVVDLIVSETGVSNRLEVSRAIYVSARNPALNEGIVGQNSTLANALLDDFGKRSIITDVAVKVGEGYARIEVYSDQNERMEFELIRNDYQYEEFVPDREGGSRTVRPSGDEYELVTSYYARAEGDYVSSGGGRGGEVSEEVPKVRGSLIEIAEEEIIDTLNALFDEIPFTGVLNAADEKFLSFLMENGVYWFGSRETTALTSLQECIDRTDRLIVDEYVLQLLSGIEANYILDELEIRYPVRLQLEDRIPSNSEGCRAITEFF